jgi:hypothetical protein
MDLLTALKILARQWPVVVAGLVLTVVGIFQVGAMVAPSYEAKGTALLLSPGANANPYLDFGPNLEVAADALMVVIQSPVGTETLEASGGAVGSFKLERTNGPLIDITATAVTADDAARTVDLVVTALVAELETAQTAAPVDQRITLKELTEPVPVAKLGSRIRAQAAVGALGLVCTVTAGLTVDAIRRQRKDARAQAGQAAANDYEGPQASVFPQAMSYPAEARPANGSYRVPARSAAGARAAAQANGKGANGAVNGRATRSGAYPARPGSPAGTRPLRGDSRDEGDQVDWR